MGIGLLARWVFFFSIFSRQWTGVGREDGGWGWVWIKPIEFGSDTKLMQALRLGFAWKVTKHNMKSLQRLHMRTHLKRVKTHKSINHQL